ncbi:MAG: phosphopantetheine adenylyltransferase, partial [Panacagrimonas sp.]
SLLAASFIHLLPAIGMISAARLAGLYGVAPADPTILLLLRHRAVLFAVLGLGFGAAAFVPALRVPAAVLSLVTMLSFVWLAQAHAHGGAIRRVVRVDVVVSVLVAAALIATAVA